jgi:hypothetical protein
LPEEVVYWRINFMVGAVLHPLAAAPLVRLVSGGRCDPTDVQTAVTQLTEFLSGGFNAGSKATRRETHLPSRPGRNARRRD